MYKKALTVLLALVLLFSVAVGCSGGGSADDINLDIDLDNKPTLSLYMPNISGVSDTTTNRSVPAKVIEEKTGYTVNYTQQPAVEIEQAINTAILDKRKFDAIKVSKAQFDYLMERDVLLDIKPAIDKFGTNLKTKISQQSWDMVTYDGKILGIPEKASSDSVDMTLIFRKDKLREANINTLPETTGEFKTMLESLNTFYSRTNPMYKPFGFAAANTVVPAIASAFGVSNGWGEDSDRNLENYIETEEIKDYIKYMADLKSSGLIDEDSIGSQQMGDAISKFAKNDISCMVIGYWNISEVLSKLSGQQVINSSELEVDTFEDVIAYAPYLKGPGDTHATWRSGGLSYVTIFPFYMNQNAAYAVDMMDKKLETDTFKEIVIGKEGQHHEKSGDDYFPLDFSDYEFASSLLTGVDEENYTAYWLARVRKSAEMYRCWNTAMQRADEIGVFNLAMNAPPLMEFLKKRRSNVDADAIGAIARMINIGYSDEEYNTALSNWRTRGGSIAKEELNAWYPTVRQ